MVDIYKDHLSSNMSIGFINDGLQDTPLNWSDNMAEFWDIPY